MNEWQTLAEVVKHGTSLARFGDGEINILHGRDATRQKWCPEIQAELEGILRFGHCLVGMPHAEGKRKAYWEKYLERYPVPHGDYGSSFVSRFDEADIDYPMYRRLLAMVWERRDVVLLTGSLEPGHLVGAESVVTIRGPVRDAYRDIDRLEAEIGSPDLAILSLGPTATCLADRLARKGVQAVDLGYVGKFL